MKNKDMETKKFCPKCGHKIPEGNQFCENCGYRINQEAEEFEDKTEYKKENATGEKTISPAAKRNRMIIAAAAIVVIVAGCLGGFLFFNSKAEATEYTDKLTEASRYIDQGDNKAAEQILIDLIEKEPKKEAAYVQLADMYSSEGKDKKAKEILKKYPKDAEGNQKVGVKLREVAERDGYKKHLAGSKLATVNKKYHAGERGDGLVSSQAIEIDGELCWIETSFDQDNRKLTITLNGIRDEKFKQLDKRTIVLKEDYAFGARYDVFLQEHDQNQYVCVGYTDIYNAHEKQQGIKVFRIAGDQLEDDNTAAIFSLEGQNRTELNDKKVAGYGSPDLGLENYDQEEAEEAFKNGLKAVNKGMKEIGLDIPTEGVVKDYKIDENVFYYDKDESSQTHICHIISGTYMDESDWDDTECLDTTIINDYTDLRNKISKGKTKDQKKETKEKEEKADADSPLDFYKKINQVGHTYKSVNKEYDISVPESVMDSVMVGQSADQDFEFTFIGTYVGPADWDYEVMDKDECEIMSGKASKMLGIDEKMALSEFEKETGLDMEYGEGLSIGTGGYTGMTANFHVDGSDKDVQILLKDVSADGSISPDTMVYVERPIEY